MDFNYFNVFLIVLMEHTICRLLSTFYVFFQKSQNPQQKGRFLRPGSILGEFKTSDGAKKKIKSIEPGGFLEKILAEVDENLLTNRKQGATSFRLGKI